MKRRLIIAASLFVFNLSSGFAVENIPFSPQPPEIHAGSWVLMDYTTGQILTAGNEHQQRNPASLTKLMTGYVAVSYTHLYGSELREAGSPLSFCWLCIHLRPEIH